MKRFCILLMALCLHMFAAHAQQSEEATSILSYLQKAMNFNKVIPQEKVYLHLDNTGYFENETIWFKAYVTRTDSSRFTDLSKVLYVELLNPTGDVMQTQKYPIDSLGQAHGEMKLDTILGAGHYELRAYTRYMTNWGAYAAFSRVIPVFKKPAVEGDYSDLTIRTIMHKERLPNNRTTADSLYRKMIIDGIHSRDLHKTVSVQFYPEGGSLVRGQRCRVAMLAVDDNGNPYSGEGFVLNEAGDVLASVQTDTLGRGLFEVMPDGSPLTFQMRNLKKSDRRAFQNFSLPEVQREGCALLLDAVSDSMSVTLQCTDSLRGSLLGYALMSNGNVFRCDTFSAVPLMEIEMDRKSMPEGVSQMTVFDSRGRIWAERLFFLCPEKRAEDSIRVIARTQRLKPCGRVELELQALPNAHLSFSAMDAQTMTNGSRGNMQTWMLLSSEVRGYIHNVDYYFEADDAEHRRSADLLMLTQGWRRYDWELMTGQRDFEKAQPIEDKFYVYGKLNAYRKRNPVNDVELEAFLYNKEGQSLTGVTRTDSLGNYAFELPFMDGEWKMQIYTRKKNKRGKEKRKTYYVGIDRQFSPVPRYITRLETDIERPLPPNLFVKGQEWSVEDEEEEFIPITKKDHVLQNVTVKAKRRYFTNDDWRYKNEAFGKQYAALYYNVDKEVENYRDRGEPVPTPLQFLREKIHLSWGIYSELMNSGSPDFIDGDYAPNGGEVLSNPMLGDYNMSEKHQYSDVWDERNVKFIYDNNDRYNSRDQIVIDYLDEIKSIYIVFDERISSALGSIALAASAPQQTIFVYIYHHYVFPTESQKGLRRTYFQGFNKPSTFQMEDYSIIPPMADFRRTIYWNPNVKTDAQGKAKVEFFNNSTCEEMYISVEGMTEDGKVLVNE